MNRNIRVEGSKATPVAERRIELVERKGIGHPDTLCDGIAESVMRELSQEYLDRFGGILHHNTDESQLVAGRSDPQFGGGNVVQPIYILIVGRATKEFDGESIPADTIAVETAREYVREALENIDTESEVIVDCRMGEGSTDLKDVFEPESGSAPSANDTSFGIGYAPFSPTERVVHDTEHAIYAKLREDIPAVGEDVKIMGKRDGDTLDLTVAVATVAKHVDDLDAYISVMDDVEEFVHGVASDRFDGEVNVAVNTADDRDEGSVYLTETGTSAEMGDDGSVGRGNRANGLITPAREMSLEAASGKNPFNHIGKLYNLLASELSNDVYEEVDGVEEASVKLLSQIGSPIDEPQVAAVNVHTEEGVTADEVEYEVGSVIDDGLEDVTSITQRIINGELGTF
ncbi:methionine adenosyltransferase [Haladaptatus sp. F3-133]|jgi:S-adenosylmethionine synthetase|uniref:S-adenosylmethionine synthase n=1 Tax=Halorutilus salinus TaxID=2487751 RepID=A0A9Q4GIL3_9EURY|nr:methionine adenosyltransferase [Halorutilus salinus]MCX2818933.1 methionine adenosyltransferase [Halorutilus salinus]